MLGDSGIGEHPRAGAWRGRVRARASGALNRPRLLAARRPAGKSCIVVRYAYNRFSDFEAPTIGAAYAAQRFKCVLQLSTSWWRRLRQGEGGGIGTAARAADQTGSQSVRQASPSQLCVCGSGLAAAATQQQPTSSSVGSGTDAGGSAVYYRRCGDSQRAVVTRIQRARCRIMLRLCCSCAESCAAARLWLRVCMHVWRIVACQRHQQ